MENLKKFESDEKASNGLEKKELELFLKRNLEKLELSQIDTILIDYPEIELSKFFNGIKVENLSNDNTHLSQKLASYLGQRVAVITKSRFVRDLEFYSDNSDILNIEFLDLSKNHVLNEVAMNENDEKKPVFIDTYAEFPELFRFYLQEMEKVKSLLIVIQEVDGNLKQKLIDELKKKLQNQKKKISILPNLPKMNFDDLKTNLANIISLAKQSNSNPDDLHIKKILQHLDSLKRLIKDKHEYSLNIEGIPQDVQELIDKNNLVLSIYETDLRYAIVNEIKDKTIDSVDGFVVLGSVAWGPYYEVKESSDVDLEIIYNQNSIAEFLSQVSNSNELTEEEQKKIFINGKGKIFTTLKTLFESGYVSGSNDFEKIKDLIYKFKTFFELNQISSHSSEIIDKTGYHRGEKLGDSFVDYMSYKINVKGSDVSIHVLPTSTFESGCNLDLANVRQTQILNEIRIGEKKKQKTTNIDATMYPGRCSFEGQSCDDFESVVSAVLKKDEKIFLYKPSELAKHGIDEKDIIAWITSTPCCIIKNNKLHHGLFQDKEYWGDLDEKSATNLKEAKDNMYIHILDRFIKEFENGSVEESGSSILKLTARYERIPAFTKRKLIKKIKEKNPILFANYREILDKIGSNELEIFKL